MNRVLLGLLPLLLAACNVHSKNPASGDDNVNIQADASGNISFDLPFAKGQVKVPSGFMHDGDIDIDGVKLMPGSQVTGVNVQSHDQVSNAEISFTAPQSPADVRSYFVDEFKKQGIEATISGDTVKGMSKDGNPFTIEVGAAGSGSQGKIVAQDNDRD